MTKLERLQALEREATKGPWVWDEDGDLMALWELEPCDGDIVLGMYTGYKPEPADAALIAALRNAAPDLIRVAVALQDLGHEPGCLIDPFSTLTDEERDESKCDCILSLLAPLLEELGE